jgi:hypothetical protein
MLYNPYSRGGNELVDSWSNTDVLCSYGNYDCGIKCDIRVDVVDFNENIFTINNCDKTKKYFLVHKAILNGWTQETLELEINTLKQHGFEEFTLTSSKNMNEIMQHCSVFVSFDLNTYVSNIAVLCGALSMIYKPNTHIISYEYILENRGSYGSIGIIPFNLELLYSPYNYEERLTQSDLYRKYINNYNNIDEFVEYFSLTE